MWSPVLHYVIQANLSSEPSGEAQACEAYEGAIGNNCSPQYKSSLAEGPPCQRSPKQALAVPQTLSSTGILKPSAPKGPHKVFRH